MGLFLSCRCSGGHAPVRFRRRHAAAHSAGNANGYRALPAVVGVS